MAFTAKILSSRFRHLNVLGCLLKRRPAKGGGVHGHPRTPPSYAPECSSKQRPLYALFSPKQKNIFLFKTHLFILPRTSRNTYWIVDSFTQIKSANYMVKSKTKSISNLGTFSNFLKLNVQSIIFSKFPHEIEAAAICFSMERGRRKSQQNSRICVRAQIKLVYPV